MPSDEQMLMNLRADRSEVELFDSVVEQDPAFNNRSEAIRWLMHEYVERRANQKLTDVLG